MRIPPACRIPSPRLDWHQAMPANQAIAQSFRGRTTVHRFAECGTAQGDLARPDRTASIRTWTGVGLTGPEVAPIFEAFTWQAVVWFAGPAHLVPQATSLIHDLRPGPMWILMGTSCTGLRTANPNAS